MNEPLPRVQTDADVGPLDEHGQQIWSAEEEAAIERIEAEPGYLASLEAANADIEAGNFYTTGEIEAHMQEVRRRYLAERGR